MILLSGEILLVSKELVISLGSVSLLSGMILTCAELYWPVQVSVIRVMYVLCLQVNAITLEFHIVYTSSSSFCRAPGS